MAGPAWRTDGTQADVRADVGRACMHARSRLRVLCAATLVAVLSVSSSVASAQPAAPARPGTAQAGRPPAAAPATPQRSPAARPAAASASSSVDEDSTSPGRQRVPRPLDGAFGVQFDAELPRHLRGGALPGAPLPLPAAVGAAPVDSRPGVQLTWTAVRPPTIPQLLVSLRPVPSYAVLLDDGRQPVRILGEARSPNCPSLFVALGKRLAERYGEPSDAAAAPAGVDRYQLFTSAKRYVQLACSGDRLLLDYIDTRGIVRWQSQHQGRIAAYDRRQRLALAARIASSRAGLIDGAFGLEFGRPCAIDGVLPDIDADVLPPRPFAAWPGARYELMVDPDGYPIRIAAKVDFVDANAAAAERQRVVAALAERYGAPRRNKPLYSVISRGGRHAVVLQEGNQLSLVFMDNERLQSQRARLQMRQTELAEAADRQRAAERAGL